MMGDTHNHDGMVEVEVNGMHEMIVDRKMCVNVEDNLGTHPLDKAYMNVKDTLGTHPLKKSHLNALQNKPTNSN